MIAPVPPTSTPSRFALESTWRTCRCGVDVEFLAFTTVSEWGDVEVDERPHDCTTRPVTGTR